jgi:hypothetical protein
MSQPRRKKALQYTLYMAAPWHIVIYCALVFSKHTSIASCILTKFSTRVPRYPGIRVYTAAVTILILVFGY